MRKHKVHPTEQLPTLNSHHLESTSPDIVQGKENSLFPVFLKLEHLRLLLIGGGNVAIEKLMAVTQNAPRTRIHLVAIEVRPEIYEMAAQNPLIQIEERACTPLDLEDCDLVIAAVNDLDTGSQISQWAHQRGKLVNVADKPELCDFYMSSVVRKGNLKIAISTNGKSPTLAKRLKEQIGEMIPDEIDEVLDNMEVIRKGLKGDFASKVKHLNELTMVLAAKQINMQVPDRSSAKRWQKIVGWCLLAFFFMVLGHGILSYIAFGEWVNWFRTLPKYIDTKVFLIMWLTGFIAQMVDGSLGMGYGTISTTFLLANGINPAIVSSRVHSARVFSSGVSGYSHHRFGNINKKLFKSLVLPGILGAVSGAVLAYFAQRYALYIKIPLSLYTVYLGFFIMKKAFRKRPPEGRVRKAGWLAMAGGFMDSFAGGGWGTLVTSTLIAKRKSPRYVIGSVCLAEFFVVLCSSITFFLLLKSLPLLEILGLILGGLMAAPLAAKLVGKVPVKKMFVAIGVLVILTSLVTLWNTLHQLPHF